MFSLTRWHDGMTRLHYSSHTLDDFRCVVCRNAFSESQQRIVEIERHDASGQTKLKMIHVEPCLRERTAMRENLSMARIVMLRRCISLNLSSQSDTKLKNMLYSPYIPWLTPLDEPCDTLFTITPLTSHATEPLYSYAIHMRVNESVPCLAMTRDLMCLLLTRISIFQLQIQTTKGCNPLECATHVQYPTKATLTEDELPCHAWTFFERVTLNSAHMYILVMTRASDRVVDQMLAQLQQSGRYVSWQSLAHACYNASIQQAQYDVEQYNRRVCDSIACIQTSFTLIAEHILPIISVVKQSMRQQDAILYVNANAQPLQLDAYGDVWPVLLCDENNGITPYLLQGQTSSISDGIPVLLQSANELEVLQRRAGLTLRTFIQLSPVVQR